MKKGRQDRIAETLTRRLRLWNGVFWVLIHSKQLSDRDLFSREEYEWKN